MNTVFSLRGALGGLAAFLSIRRAVRFFTGAVEEAANFEEALSRVQSVSQASEEDMRRLREAAEDMGARTTFNANQAASAMETLSRAGLNTTETLNALPEVLALARGNSIELAEAASLVTSAAQGMGIAFEESGRVADVLTRAAQRANTNVTGLGQALSFAAPTARSLGVSLEETAALVGGLANAGIDASRAGTSLNNIFTQFADAGSTFRRELGEIGITTDDFGQALEEIEAAGPRAEQAILALGRQGGPAMRALLGQGSEAIAELTHEVENAEGASQAAADTMDNVLNGAIERLGSAWRTLRRRLGDNVLEPVKNGIDELATGIVDFVRSGGIEEMGAAFRRTVESMIAAIRQFLHDFDIRDAVDRAASALDATAGAFSRAAAAARATAGAVQIVWHALQTLAGGIASFITGTLAVFMEGFTQAAEILSRFGVVSGDVADAMRRHTNAMTHAAEEVMDYTRESFFSAADASARFGYALRDLRDAQDTNLQSTLDLTDATDDSASAAEDAWSAHEKAKGAIEDGVPVVTEMADVNERLAAAQDKAGDSAGSAAEDVLSLADAYKRLGIEQDEATEGVQGSAREAFQAVRESGEATREELAQAFDAYAAEVAESGDEVEQALLRHDATAAGFTDRLRELGAVGRQAGEGAAEGMNDAAEATEQASESADRFAQSATQAGNAGGGFGRGLAEMLGGVTEALSGASQRVQDLWQSQVEGAARAGRSVRRYMQDVGQTAERLVSRVQEQQQAFDELMGRVNAASDSTEDLEWIANLTTGRFGDLGQETLAPLRNAIDQANQRLEQLRSNAESTLHSLQDELLQLQGREEELAERRRDRRRDEIREQLAEARAAGDDQAVADLQKALSTLNQIAREESKQRREQEQEQERRRQDRERQEKQQRQHAQQRDRESREQERRQEQRMRPQGPSRTVRLQLDSGESIDAPEGQADQFVRALERKGMSTR